MRRLVVLAALLALAACSTAPPPRPMPSAPPTKPASSVEADRLVRDADARLRGGDPAGALHILEGVVRRFPDAPVHDRALYELAQALVLSGPGAREYRQAAVYLDRLLREHPGSPHVADARVLRAALGAYIARTVELERLLDRLRAIDLEFERPRQP